MSRILQALPVFATLLGGSIVIFGLTIPPAHAQESPDSLLDLSPGSKGIGSIPPVGRPLPAFEFPTLDGGSVSSQELDAPTTVFILWSINCSGANRVIAALDSLRESSSLLGTELVLVSFDTVPAQLREALGPHGTGVTVALASNPIPIFTNPDVHRRYKPTVPRAVVIPSFVILDSQGVVRHSQLWHGAGNLIDAVRRVSEGLDADAQPHRR